ncbi:hypothetical protein ACMX25_12390 [Caballeronia sp. 15715]|uniref:TapB family protein n=1 Tax=Caballeronia sp. 15715 TaxID=3391030 RepID=UPI0039E48FCB
MSAFSHAAFAAFCLGALPLTAFAVADPSDSAPPPSANAPVFAAGERWEFAYENTLEPRLNERYSQTVESAAPSATTLVNNRGGHFHLDADSNLVETPATRYEPSDGRLKFPMAVGQSWSTTYVVRSGAWTAKCDRTSSVVAAERIKTPAGEFDAFRIEQRVAWAGMGASQGSGLTLERDWYAPAVGRIVKVEYEDKPLKGPVTATTAQLVEYSPAAAALPSGVAR